LFIVCFSFSYGFVVSLKKIFPYDIIIKTYYSITSITKNEDIKPEPKKLTSCNINKIDIIPPGSRVFIGHAYGSPEYPKNYEEFINDKVFSFIQENANLLDSIIFTGDIFDIPSKKKWDKLYNFTKGVKIYITPGNHDILRPDSREAFERSKFGIIEYPYYIKSNFTDLILEDSISTNWNTSKKTINYLKNNDKNRFIIARHNVPIKELLSYVNSQAGMGDNLETFNALKKHIGDGDFTWIIGDTGAFPNLPRLKCLKNNNFRFILNGVGDLIGDSIIVEIEGKLYEHTLERYNY
jgi:calcineurin-like phosphoesterase family protein